MTHSLSIDRVVRVSVNLQPLAAGYRDFSRLLILGDSPIIDREERLRSYADLDGVGGDFGLSSPEYKAAALFFSQTPRPAALSVGRWASRATPALLKGAILSDAACDLDVWRAITAGTLTVRVGGIEQTLGALDFSTITNLNGVAVVVSQHLDGATLSWDGSRFLLESEQVGAAARLDYATGDLAEAMHLSVSTALPPIDGGDVEKIEETVALLADRFGDWYGLMVAAEAPVSNEDHINVARFIQGTGRSRVYGVTLTDSRVLDASVTNDLASRLEALNLRRTFVQYAQDPHAVASFFGRAFSVNFEASRSTLTMKFKTQPGIVCEHLSETKADTLKAKRCNVFVAYNNDTAIIQEGVMSGDAYFDEIHGLDWLQNAIQTDVWNLLYQSKTKVPQTDSGINQILTCIEATLGRSVNNGLIAPGVWNADGFGQLERAQLLPKGYYVYAPAVAAQSQADREARKAVPIQIAVKLAGAVHSVDVQIDVNR